MKHFHANWDLLSVVTDINLCSLYSVVTGYLHLYIHMHLYLSLHV